MSSSVQKHPKDLDPSDKTEIGLWDCFGRENKTSYNQRKMIVLYDNTCGVL